MDKLLFSRVRVSFLDLNNTSTGTTEKIPFDIILMEKITCEDLCVDLKQIKTHHTKKSYNEIRRTGEKSV